MVNTVLPNYEGHPHQLTLKRLRAELDQLNKAHVTLLKEKDKLEVCEASIKELTATFNTLLGPAPAPVVETPLEVPTEPMKEPNV